MNASRCRAALCVAALSGLFAAGPAFADAVISIVNSDGAGEGFNDPSAPAAAAGCNAGETLGQCRLRVFQVAAEQWGRLLNSTVEIKVQSSMNPLTCNQTTAVLGSAGPINAVADFPNAPRAGVAYNIAEANALAGSDQDPGSDDILAQFNLSIDSGTCLTGTTGWWYGTDQAVPFPSDRVPLLPVVFHELGHGLGFVANTSLTSGAYLTAPDRPVWADYLYDVATAKLWKDMTNAERVASAKNDPNLVWTGPRANKQSPQHLGPAPMLVVNAPAAIAGSYAQIQVAAFGPPPPSGGITADVVLAANAGSAGPNDGCTAFTNAAAVAGKIALVDRGACNFTVKVANAQAAGAVGALVANNAATGLPGMGGSDATITIPSYGITQALGTQIKANLPAPGVNATIGYDPSGLLAGTKDGCLRMFAPNPLQQGSSVSHWSDAAFPPLLMQPALNTKIFDKVDLTLPAFQDIDWSTNPEDTLFLDGFDPNPCQHVQP